MAGKVPKITPPKVNRSRNAFDLSQKHLFSAAPGILYPILSLDCVVNDKISLSVAQLVKSMPIVNNPFINCKGIFEFFFVPYHQVWHPFDQFQTQMMDFHSQLYDFTEPISQVPTTTFNNIKNIALAAYTPTSNRPDMFGIMPNFGVANYADLLGYGSFTNGSTQDSKGFKIPSSIDSKMFPTSDFSLNQFRWCSFQKIYQDYYRKSNYEPYNVQSYSLDNNNAGDFEDDKFVAPSAELGYKYRNYSLDLITNAVPSPNLVNNSFQTANNIIPNTYINGDNPLTWRPKDVGTTNSNIADTYAVQNNAKGQPLDAISVSSLKAAFALQKLGSLIGRADKDFKSQLDALFGSDASEGRDGKAIYAGGFDIDINFSDVLNTNGDSYGKSFSTYGNVSSDGSGHINFRCPEHGVFMCIFSIVPIIPYDSTGLDVNNIHLHYQDFYNPLFENIGMQPTSALTVQQFRPTNYLSWQPRYSEYKSAIDRNHGSFNTGNSLSSFTSGRNRGLMSSTTANWNLNMFKVNPNCLDSVFAVNFDGSSDTAPFICDFNFSIVKTSDMQLHQSSIF